MEITEIERQIVWEVTNRFLMGREATKRRPLVIKFRQPDALEKLVRAGILKDHNKETCLPLAPAFEHCGNADALRLAKRSVEVVLHVLQKLFDADLEQKDFTPADIEAHARELYGSIEPGTIWLGLYLALNFGVFSGWGGNPPEGEITSLRISEGILRIGDISTAWEEHMKLHTWDAEEQSQLRARMPQGGWIETDLGPTDKISIMISHSSKDAQLAAALIDLLRNALGISPDKIRCSSVDGYRLPAGVTTDLQLKAEVSVATVLIGLITPHSLLSPYVLFELGARWGGGRSMIPLLAGVEPDELRGPLRGLNALSCRREAQIHQLLEEVSKPLNMRLQNASSYSQFVSRLASMSVLPAHDKASAAAPMVFADSVMWKPSGSTREGPYCPNCFEDKAKEIHLNRGASKGTFSCGVCGNSFRTSAYNPSAVRRRAYRARRL